MKTNLSIVPYYNSYEEYLKKLELNELVNSIINININIDEERLLCKKLRQKLGKNNRFAKIMKCIKK